MTTTPTKPTPKDASPPEAPLASAPAEAQPAPASEVVQLAVIYTPELNEACLQSVRGGSLSWAFGPVTNPTTLRINPGLNAPVPRDLWERAKQRPDTQILMGRGLIQEIELTDGATNADGQLSLAAVPPPEAFRLICGCRNTEQLEIWLRKEDRQQLRERLAARIKEINDGRP
jgi:hypothetical protein